MAEQHHGLGGISGLNAHAERITPARWPHDSATIWWIGHSKTGDLKSFLGHWGIWGGGFL